jgi:excisionase family DNA binding protein
MSVIERISFSIQEFAVQHGVNVKTVRRMIDRGELRAFRIGTSIRIAKSEIDRLMAAR